MPDSSAGRALLVQGGSTRRAGVSLFFVGVCLLENGFFDGSACPVQEPSGTKADRIFAHRTEKAFVSLSVLPGKPLHLRKRNNSDEIYEQSAYSNEQHTDENVPEVLCREILMHDQGDFDKRRGCKGEE